MCVLGSDGRVVRAVNAETTYTTASVGKIFLLCEAAQQIADGRIDPAVTLTANSAPCAGGSGLWQHLDQEQLSVADICTLIGSVSDNLATNVLLERVGLAAVTARARALGCQESGLHDMVRDTRGPDDPPRLSSGNAQELAEVALRIHVAATGGTGDGITPAAATLVEQWLLTGTDLSLVAAPFRLDPLEHGVFEPWMLWNKTGSDVDVRADLGVVTRGETFVAYAAIATWGSGDLLTEEPFDLMHGLGRSIRHDLEADA
jgi:beta-lactamase class A